MILVCLRLCVCALFQYTKMLLIMAKYRDKSLYTIYERTYGLYQVPAAGQHFRQKVLEAIEQMRKQEREKSSQR